MTRTDLPREKLSTLNLWEIGQHARDALGKFASRCQARRLALEIIWRHRYPPLEFFNPWYVDDLVHDDPWQMIGGGINWVNTDHVLDIALGGAIAAMNDGLRELDAEEVDADIVEKFAAEGAQKGYQLAMDAMRETFKATEERFRNRYSK